MADTGQKYILVKKKGEKEATFELPIQEDGTLLLSTLRDLFPDATGLSYKKSRTVKNSKKKTVNKKVRLESGKLYPPSNTDQKSPIFFISVAAALTPTTITDFSKLCVQGDSELSQSDQKTLQNDDNLTTRSAENKNVSKKEVHATVKSSTHNQHEKNKNQMDQSTEEGMVGESLSQKTREGNIHSSYPVLPGTIDRGKEYECIVLARLILELVLDDRVKDFKASLNNGDFLPFDDVVIETETVDTTENYAIQLKHSNVFDKSLTVFELRRKNDLDVNKYFQKLKEFQKLEKFKWFLFTNRISDYGEGTEFKLESENLDIKIIQCETDPLFEKSFKSNFSYKFQSSEAPDDQRYLRNFFLYTCQPNAEEMEEQLARRFQEAFDCEKTAFLKFYNFINDWNKKEENREKLTKKWIREVITIILLSPQTLPLSANSINEEKFNIFRKSVDKFNITVLEKNNSERITQLWNIKNEIEDVGKQKIDEVRSHFQAISGFTKNSDDFTHLESSIILWLLDKCPLVIKYKENITKAIRLCEDKKFIVIYDNALDERIRNKFGNMLVFQNLTDLKKETSCYENLVKNLSCSLQGKSQITLETLINESEQFRKCISINDLLLFLDDDLVLGEEKDDLHLYIPRSFSRQVIAEEFLETCSEDIVIVIDYFEETDRYNGRFEIKNIENTLNSGPGTKISENAKKTLYVSKNRCNREQLEALCEIVEGDDKKLKKFHHFRMFETKLEWISSTAPVNDLKKFLNQNKNFNPNVAFLQNWTEFLNTSNKGYFIKEEEFYYNENDDVNTIVFCGEPGLGKTTLMQNFRKTMFPLLWTILLYPKDHSRHLKEIKGDVCKFEQYIQIEIGKEYSDFELKVFEIMLKTGRVNYIWDGLDEISEESLNSVLDIIEALLKKGSKQCLTSRNNLREDLENRFCVLAKTIKEFDEHDQKCYIRKRFNCDDTEMETMYTKISKKINFFKHEEILCIPLQIYIFTELLLQNNEKYDSLLEEIFSLTDLYEHFIDMKFNIYFEEKENLKNCNDYVLKRLNKDKENRIMEYQLIALKLYFPDKTLEDSNYEKLLSEFKPKDEFGIITSISSEDVVNFLHNSYGEYFAALYFSKNYEKVQNLRFLFKEKYKNIRFMFDLILAKGCPAHIATLCRNPQQLESYDEDLLTKMDQGGRSPLHLACSWGTSYPPLEVERKPFEKRRRYYVYLPMSLSVDESFNAVTNLKYLFEHCDPKQEDRVYKFNTLLYADRTSNLLALEILLEGYDGSVKEFKYFKNIPSLLCYAAALDFSNIFDHVKIPRASISNVKSLLAIADRYDSQLALRKIFSKSAFKRSSYKLDDSLLRKCKTSLVNIPSKNCIRVMFIL